MKKLKLHVVLFLLFFGLYLEGVASSASLGIGVYSSLEEWVGMHQVLQEKVQTWILGSGIQVHADVWNPKISSSSAVQTANLIDAFKKQEIKFGQEERFLEMGCGCGLTSIAVARLYSVEVDAVDINEHAVLVTRENIKNEHLEKFIHVSQGNLFENIKKGTKYKVIYWEVPYYRHLQELMKGMTNGLLVAVWDPEWKTLGRFLDAVPEFLQEDGSLFLGWGDDSRTREPTESLMKFFDNRGFTSRLVAPSKDRPRYKIYQLNRKFKLPL